MKNIPEPAEAGSLGGVIFVACYFSAQSLKFKWSAKWVPQGLWIKDWNI